MIILRMQGLPWSATAKDIRQHFQGLSIPDGGVHIIGGEEGDVFIAFSTDEDARKAMQRQKQPLGGSRIILLLSSKSEMQEVIAENRAVAPPVRKVDPFAPGLAIPSPSQTLLSENQGRDVPLSGSTNQRYNDPVGGMHGYPKDPSTVSSQSYPPAEYSSLYYDSRDNQGIGKGPDGIKLGNETLRRDHQDFGQGNAGLGQTDNRLVGPANPSFDERQQGFGLGADNHRQSGRSFRPENQGIRQNALGYRRDAQEAGRDQDLGQDTRGFGRDSRDTHRDIQGYGQESGGFRRYDYTERANDGTGRIIQDDGSANRSFGLDRQEFKRDNQSIGLDVQGFGRDSQGVAADTQVRGQDNQDLRPDDRSNRLHNQAFRREGQDFDQDDQAFGRNSRGLSRVAHDQGPGNRTFGRDSQDLGKDDQIRKSENPSYGRVSQGPNYGKHDEATKTDNQGLERNPHPFGLGHIDRRSEYRGDSAGRDSTGRGEPLLSRPESASGISGKEKQMTSMLMADEQSHLGSKPSYGGFEHFGKDKPHGAWQLQHDGPVTQRNVTRTLLPSPDTLDQNPPLDDFMGEISTSYPPSGPAEGFEPPVFSDADHRIMGNLQSGMKYDNMPLGDHEDPGFKHTLGENAGGRFHIPKFGDATWVAENSAIIPSLSGSGQAYGDLNHGTEREGLNKFPAEPRQSVLSKEGLPEAQQHRSPFSLENQSRPPGNIDSLSASEYPAYPEQSVRRSDFDNRSSAPQFQSENIESRFRGTPTLLNTDVSPQYGSSKPLLESPVNEQNAVEEKIPFYAVRLSGLPYSCTEKDIEEFFKGVNIASEGLQLHVDRHGRQAGTANVKLVGKPDLEEALSRHRKYMGRRYIDVFDCTLTYWESRVKDAKPLAKKDQSMRSKKSPIRGSSSYVEMKGLPPYMKEIDVQNFFERLSIKSIFFEDTKDEYRVIVEFTDPSDVKKACEKNGSRIGRRTIAVRTISKEIVEAKKNIETKRKSERRSPGRRSPDRKRTSSPRRERSPFRRGRSPSYRSSSRSSPGKNGRRAASPSSRDRETSRTRNRGSSPVKNSSQDKKDSLSERKGKEFQQRDSPSNRSSRLEEKKSAESPIVSERANSDSKTQGNSRSLLADPPAKERLPPDNFTSNVQGQSKTHDGGQNRKPESEKLDSKPGVDSRGEERGLHREQMHSRRREGRSRFSDDPQKLDQREQEIRPGLLDRRPPDLRDNSITNRQNFMDSPKIRPGINEARNDGSRGALPSLMENLKKNDMGPRKSTERDKGPWDRPHEDPMNENESGKLDKRPFPERQGGPFQERQGGPFPERQGGPFLDRYGGPFPERRGGPYPEEQGGPPDRRGGNDRHGNPGYNRQRGPSSGKEIFRGEGHEYHLRDEVDLQDRHIGGPNDRKRGPMRTWHGPEEDRPPMEPFRNRRGLLDDPEIDRDVPEKRGRFDQRETDQEQKMGHHRFDRRDCSPDSRHRDEGPRTFGFQEQDAPQHRGHFPHHDGFPMHKPGEEEQGGRPGSIQMEPGPPAWDGDQWTERPETSGEQQGISEKEYCCAHVRNIPFQARWPEVAQFFNGLNIVPGGIHIMLGPDGRTNGHCFIEFVDSHQARMSEERHVHRMRDRPVQINACSKMMMIRSIEQAGELQQNIPFSRRHEPNPHGPRQPFRPRGPHGPGFRGNAPGPFPGPRGPHFGPHAPRHGAPFRPPFGDPQRPPFRESPRPPFRESQRPPFGESQKPPFGESQKPPNKETKGGDERSATPQEPSPGDKPPISKQLESPKTETKSKDPDVHIKEKLKEESKTSDKEVQQKIAPDNKTQATSIQSSGNKGIVDSNKGCIVCATNLPLTITVDTIRDFFKGFDTVKGAVKLDTNEITGKASGQAKIVFSSPAEANRAIKVLNNRPLNGRIVRLHVV